MFAPTNAHFDTSNGTLAAGRRFEKHEERAGSAVCVIGATMQRALFAGADPLGQHLRVKSFSCEVVGVIAAKGQGATGLDRDDMVVLPLRTLQRRATGSTRVNTLLVSVRDEAGGIDRAGSALTQLLRERRKLAALASLGLAQLMQVPIQFNPAINALALGFSAARSLSGFPRYPSGRPPGQLRQFERTLTA